jgi:hypothetical protein
MISASNTKKTLQRSFDPFKQKNFTFQQQKPARYELSDTLQSKYVYDTIPDCVNIDTMLHLVNEQ